MHIRYSTNQLLLLLAGCMACISLGCWIAVSTVSSDTTFTVNSTASTSAQLSTTAVDISGAVKKPGVYRVQEGDRIGTVIDRAGGLTDTASVEYVHRHLNRARYVADEDKIYIPSREDVKAGFTSGEALDSLPYTAPSEEFISSPTESRLSINSASATELDTLPGVGSKTSEKIIQGRPYASLEDLVSRKIISQKMYMEIADLLTL